MNVIYCAECGYQMGTGSDTLVSVRGLGHNIKDAGKIIGRHERPEVLSMPQIKFNAADATLHAGSPRISHELVQAYKEAVAEVERLTAENEQLKRELEMARREG